MAFARTEVEHGVPGKGLLALAVRSGEFDAANQLLNRGAKLHGLALAPALVLWPDCGPESETDRPRVAQASSGKLVANPQRERFWGARNPPVADRQEHSCM